MLLCQQSNVRLVKAMVFPVVMYGCESWTVKKAECQRIDAFELWCWRRLLRVPWTARRSNQSILKEISPGCSLEGMMLKLKLQYFGHLRQRVESLEMTLMLGRIGGRRRRGQQRMRWLDGITDSMDVFEWTPGVGDGQGGLACCNSWGCRESDTPERLNWTELNPHLVPYVKVISKWFKPKRETYNYKTTRKKTGLKYTWLWLKPKFLIFDAKITIHKRKW